MPDLPARSLTFTGRIRSFGFAIRGVATMLRSQHNAWIHAAATIGATIAGVFFPDLSGAGSCSRSLPSGLLKPSTPRSSF